MQPAARKYRHGETYSRWCLYRLSVDFPRLPLYVLRSALMVNNEGLIPTYRAVALEYNRAERDELSEDHGLAGTVEIEGMTLSLLKTPRIRSSPPHSPSQAFRTEWTALEKELSIFMKLQQVKTAYFPTHARKPLRIEIHSAIEENTESPMTIEKTKSAGPNKVLNLVLANSESVCAQSDLGKIRSIQRDSMAPRRIFTCQKTTTHQRFVDKRQDLSKDWHPFSQADERRSSNELENDLNLSKSLNKKAGTYFQILKSTKVDLSQDRARNNGASGPELRRCPLCKELYMVNSKSSILICPNELCSKNMPTSCRRFEHSCEETDVGRKEKKYLTTSEEPLLNPLERDKDDTVGPIAEPVRTAVIQCSSCEGKILKFGGCNRLTCLCGQTVCYKCRACLPQDSRYEHFCHHERYHNRLPCTLCNLCDLYEQQVVEIAQKQKKTRYDMDSVQKRRKCEEDHVAQRGWMEDCCLSCD